MTTVLPEAGRTDGRPVAELRFDPEDLERAAKLLSRHTGGGGEPRQSETRIIAGALYATRNAGIPGAVSDEELLAVHDQACGPIRHSAKGAVTDLATAMLARGMFPDSRAYNDEWWLWWPKKGRGPCPQCGQVRVLTRYMGWSGDGDQYMCQKCRRQGSQDAEDALEQATGVTPLPGESSAALSQRRLAAVLQQARDEGARLAGGPLTRSGPSGSTGSRISWLRLNGRAGSCPRNTTPTSTSTSVLAFSAMLSALAWQSASSSSRTGMSLC